MVNIGNQLKQKRLEKGLTIEEVSEKTRLTIKHIKAIEDGDISYFKDDLSYLRFFLKSYCDVLGIDFEPIKEELRDSIDDYTTSFTKETVSQHEAIERGVRENANKMKQPSVKKTNKTKPNKPKKARKHRKLDMSLLSFLAIVIVILIALIFAFVLWIQGSKNDDDNLANNQPPVAQPTYTGDAYTGDPTTKDEPVQKDPTPKEEPKELKITAVNDMEYTIENVKADSDLDIEVTFASTSRTSFRALVNGTLLSNPENKVYEPKEVVHVREKAVNGKKVQLAFGYIENIAIKVNGKQVELPASVTGKQGSAVIQFNVKGE